MLGLAETPEFLQELYGMFPVVSTGGTEFVKDKFLLLPCACLIPHKSPQDTLASIVNSLNLSPLMHVIFGNMHYESTILFLYPFR